MAYKQPEFVHVFSFFLLFLLYFQMLADINPLFDHIFKTLFRKSKDKTTFKKRGTTVTEFETWCFYWFFSSKRFK